ncbi:unnamed protein product [Adineta ricciae]|uniref:CENP-V/GFA domain-containing protein n=1 Tax=Adineta ricciae TaxID=249248 RepID=A0A813P6Y7_ADIRI|nr:unnamed protein product [Adineta ricciae]
MTVNLVTGKCLCGQISVSVPETILKQSKNVGLCYCKNCRQTGGCLASYNLYLPEKDAIIQGEPKIYLDSNTTNGQIIQRAFCENCGSPIYGRNPTSSRLIAVKLGIFDELTKPSIALFCKDRPEWNRLIDGIQDYDIMPS